jgi:hypothetical protein
MLGETKFFGAESVSGDGAPGRPASPLRKRMDTLNVGEGFEVNPESDWMREKQRAQTIANNLNPKGKSFSIRWIEAGKTFCVIRTK